MSQPLLAVEGLEVKYGRAQALFGLSFEVQDGEAIAVLGRNGAGKTTTLRAIAGFVKRQRGSIRMEGREVPTTPSGAARCGVAYVPEERRLFTKLTVGDNLQLAQQQGKWTYDVLRDRFPVIGRHWKSPSGVLSGGEQQIVAIARAMVCNPHVLLLDEPSQGLAPIVLDEVRALVHEYTSAGGAVVIVEQNLQFAQTIAAEAYVFDLGTTIARIPTADVQQDEKIASILAL